jgi:hypothetical protein
MALEVNWTHHRSIGGGGADGDDAGERWRRSRLGSDSSEGRCNAGQHVAVGVSLGLRGGAWWLGRLWKRTEANFIAVATMACGGAVCAHGEGRAAFYRCG